MSDEYRNAFISSIIVDDTFDVDEFDNFKATVNTSSLPLFRDMQTPWKLEFTINDSDKLAWSAVEYGDGDSMPGLEIMSGTVEVIVKNNPNMTYGFFDDIDHPDAHEFIATMFHGNPKVSQCYPKSSVFLVDNVIYNFDTMLSEKGYIHFQFIHNKF